MKPKEWLFKNGHITKDEVNRRGRLSAVNKALIEGAVAKGVMIDGYTVSKPTAASDKPATVSRVSKATDTVADVPEPLRAANEFSVVDASTGKAIHAVGMANVCNGCRNSFAYCPCPSPRVWLDHERETVVRFKFTGNKGG